MNAAPANTTAVYAPVLAVDRRPRKDRHFEVNRWLVFDRLRAYGMRLDIAAGTAVRFEPGDTRAVDLVALAGSRTVIGLNGLVEGRLDDTETKRLALERMRAFAGHGDREATG
jgi:hypothetical protein